MKNSLNICIVGGGITGYAFAWHLAKKAPDYTITIIEKEIVAGGLAKATKSEIGYEIDKFYHFLYNNDSKNTLDFFNEVGLKPKVIWNDIKSAVYAKDTLFSIDEVSQLMKAELLSWSDKVRFLFAICRILISDFKKLDSITSEEYLIKLFGLNNYKIIWEPLMVSKFSEYSGSVPAMWIARRIQVTFMSRGKSGKTRYGYITGTYNPLFKRVEALLKKKNVTIIKDQVAEIVQKGNKVHISTSGGLVQQYDKVVCATPITISKKIINHKNVKKQLDKYKELNVFVSLLILTHKFSDYFWINVNEPSIPFTGIIELTNLTGTKLFKGNHILYLSEYLSDKSHFNSDDFIKNTVQNLQRINPTFKKEMIIKRFDSFASGVAPIPFLNYAKNMPPFQSVQNRIYLLNSSMIYPQDRGVGNSIKLAEKHVDSFIHG